MRSTDDLNYARGSEAGQLSVAADNRPSSLCSGGRLQLNASRSPLRCAPGGMRELSNELLVSPPLRSGENQEFEQMPLRGTAQLAHSVRNDQ